MYIRIEFENMESAKTQDTLHLFYSIPNGMFLSSTNAHMLSSKELRESFGNSVVFWHLDIDVLNEHYGGFVNCLYRLEKYSGVCRVHVLPFNEKYDGFIENVDGLVTTLMKCFDDMNKYQV
jgi:hypothetical protein